MAEKQQIPSLFGEDEIPHLIKQEWKGMPEFETQDMTPDNQLIISFRNQQDRQKFASILGQRLTPKTKSVWFPKVDITRYMDKRYKYDETDETTDTAPE